MLFDLLPVSLLHKYNCPLHHACPGFLVHRSCVACAAGFELPNREHTHTLKHFIFLDVLLPCGSSHCCSGMDEAGLGWCWGFSTFFDAGQWRGGNYLVMLRCVVVELIQKFLFGAVGSTSVFFWRSTLNTCQANIVIMYCSHHRANK